MSGQTGQVSVLGLASRRRWVVGVAAGAVLLSGAGLAAAQMIKSPAQVVADSAPPAPSVLTAAVEYRVVQDSVIVRGTATAGQSVTVAPAGGGGREGVASVVTKLPAVAGDKVKAGLVLLEVSGRPVIALQGELPVYRDLKPAAKGDDIAQLQAALRHLGHGTGQDPKGYFGDGTKAALAGLYQSIGYDPLPAQPDGDNALTSAKDAVTAMTRAVEDARSGTKTGGKPSGSQAERAQEDLDKAREHLAEVQAKNGPMLPAGEVVFLSRFPARIDTVSAKVGDAVSGKVLTVSSGALVVHGYLQQQQKGLVRPGQKVDILSEVTGKTASGTVASVADTPTQGQPSATPGGDPSSTGSKGFEMLVRPDKDLDVALAGQDLRLAVQAASTGGKALVVPITAVSAGADGKASVTVREAAGTQRRAPVTTGTSGDGYVEVRPNPGTRLSAGEQVITGVQAGAEPSQ